MGLKAGDKVRFLDEKGEGTILRFIDNAQVLVQMDDGFEIPYLLAKLVPAVAPAAKPAFSGSRSADYSQETYTAAVSAVSPSLQTEGVFLVYLPVNQEQPMTGTFGVFLFNMCSLHIQFTVSSRHNGKFSCEYAGTLTPLQSCRIKEIKPEEIERWSALRVDIQFYGYEPFLPREPVSRLLKQKPARFYKESSYSASGLTPQKAITIDLTRNMLKGQEEEYFEEKDLSRIVFEKESKNETPLSKQSTKNNTAFEWEVDLHAEELVDSLRGLSNGQIVDIQLRFFQKKLDEGIAQNIRKIIFIHGVGNGRLKGEIRKILATYKGFKTHDASYSRYGVGATEVIL